MHVRDKRIAVTLIESSEAIRSTPQLAVRSMCERRRKRCPERYKQPVAPGIIWQSLTSVSVWKKMLQM